jgi:phosphate transport system permease protein
MDLRQTWQKLVRSPFRLQFSKDYFSLNTMPCTMTLLLSIVFVAIGFLSMVLSFYIGDLAVRLLLIILGILLFLSIYCSYVKMKRVKKLITMIIFGLVVIVLGFVVPLFPPEYGLRHFGFDASILKFLFVSLLFMIVGVLGVTYSLKTLYNFTSKANQLAAYFVLIFSIIIIVYPLALIIGNIIVNGAGGITWDFLTQDVSRHGSKGGVYPALIGTLLIIIGTTVIALPLGIGSAIYLSEYARGGPIVRIIRVAVDILQGVPSIVHGLFGLAFFVPLFGISVLTGVLIMSFLTLPIIIRASEEAIRAVPQSIREGSYALGATKWKTIRRVVLPPALPGIITGGVLGLGRAAGETAPIMFTAVYFIGAGIPKSPLDPIQALPTHLLQLIYYFGAYPVEQNAWATALLLLGIVLGMNAISILIREKYRVEF